MQNLEKLQGFLEQQEQGIRNSQLSITKCEKDLVYCDEMLAKTREEKNQF